MQLNVALLNAEISYARRRFDICKFFTLSTGRNNSNEQESNAVLDDSGLDLDEPVSGGMAGEFPHEQGLPL